MCVDAVAEQRQPREVAAQRATIGGRREADRHERAAPGRIGFADRDVRDAVEAQALLEQQERALVGGGERDGVRAARQIAGARLAGRVDQLRGEDAEREITPDDTVMR